MPRFDMGINIASDFGIDANINAGVNPRFASEITTGGNDRELIRDVVFELIRN